MKTEITWTAAAWEQFKDVRQKFANLAAYYGDALAMEHGYQFFSTFERVTFAAGPVNVQADGSGFLITTPHITIGLVWTPDSDERMRQRLSDPIGLAIGQPLDPSWPRTGTWSAHS